MTNNFDRALTDLGFSSFGENNLFTYVLQRETGGDILVNLYRDVDSKMLRVSALTSNAVPATISCNFFRKITSAALEPFRDGVGVGIAEEDDHVCVYFSLPIENYVSGNSVVVLAEILEQIENWDALLAAE